MVGCKERDNLLNSWNTAVVAYSEAVRRLTEVAPRPANFSKLLQKSEAERERVDAARKAFVRRREEHGCA